MTDKTLEERAEIERLRREELAQVDMSSAKAQALLGEHKTFASYSKDKFNVLMREGEKFLKDGKYYKAIDSFSMASVYKPRDPLAMAAKSHALFAAGEYMSSALFLARSLNVFPGYARMKIDIVGMVGDRDKLESRIVDVEQWIEHEKLVLGPLDIVRDVDLPTAAPRRFRIVGDQRRSRA